MFNRTLLIAAIFASTVGLQACEQKGPAEEAGAQIDEAVESAGDTVDNAMESAGESMEEAGDRIERETQ